MEEWPVIFASEKQIKPLTNLSVILPACPLPGSYPACRCIIGTPYRLTHRFRCAS